jgi:hypothetical protein
MVFVRGEEYLIQHYVIKFVSDLREKGRVVTIALYEYFSRLLTPEVQYLCKNVLILFHDFYRKINSLPLK